MQKATMLRSAPFKAAPVSRRLVSQSRRVHALQAELKVGDNLKDYPDYYRVLKASDGTSTALSSFQGKKPVVVFFYPKAKTPGCTKEACKFRDEYDVFVQKGAAVFGISSDTPEENAEWAKENRLPFPLLSDPNGTVRKGFGVPADFLGLLPGRQTFVIDKTGKCVLSFNSQLNAEQHVAEALKVL